MLKCKSPEFFSITHNKPYFIAAYPVMPASPVSGKGVFYVNVSI